MKYLYFTLVFVVCLISCQNKLEHKFDARYNTIRKEIGVPLLNENWKVYKNSVNLNNQNFVIYTNPAYNKDSSCYFSKKIVYTHDSIIMEVDTYLSGKTYSTNDGELDEAFIATYCFLKDTIRHLDQGWHYTLFNSSEYITNGKELSRAQSDSILAKWGMDPLPLIGR